MSDEDYAERRLSIGGRAIVELNLCGLKVC